MPDRRVYLDAALFVASLAAGYYGFTLLTDTLSDSKHSRILQKKGKAVLQQLNLSHLELDEHEAQLASEIVLPSNAASASPGSTSTPGVSLDTNSIGGLDSIITELRETVLLPLRYPHLLPPNSSLGGPPRGVLLHGPPGCGKSLLARSLASSSNATFINVRISHLSSKWFGESTKLISALFSLAKKTEPAVVFIDEIDAFLRVRNMGDHEVSASMKAEFMTLWDGLLSSSSRIVILGATNRPEDIDTAILRRMPKRFYVPLPDFSARLAILHIFLNPIFACQTNPSTSIDMTMLAQKTVGLSGSDLKELCRNAAMKPVREYLRSNPEADPTIPEIELRSHLRPLRMDDFDLYALNLDVGTGLRTGNGFANGNGRTKVEDEDEEGLIPGGLD